MNFVAVLTKQIIVLRRSNKLLICATGFAVLLGLVLITISFMWSKADNPDWFMFGSGIFANALAAFPFTQILTRWERIETYTEIVKCFDDCEQKPPECREQCVKFAEKVIEETVKR